MQVILVVEIECDLNPCQSLTDCNRGPKYSLSGQVLEGVSTQYLLIVIWKSMQHYVVVPSRKYGKF